jgi:hypothetical protein
VYENRMLRRIFGPKREKIKGEADNCIMRSFIIQTFHPILLGRSSQRRMKCAGNVSHMGVMKKQTILVGKPEGKMQLEGPRHRWVDNIKIYLDGKGIRMGTIRVLL